MKRKIAVCGNGWSNEYLEVVLSGIRKCAEENNTDIFFLMNYSVGNGEEYKDVGDANVFRLLEYGQFDGVILLANTFHLAEEFDYLSEAIRKLKIPAISLEYQMPDIDYLGTDNYSGMHELCTHLIEEHNAKEMLFISGPGGNAESDSRRKALEDVLKEHQLSLKDDYVICGNWNYFEVQEQLPIWLDEHAKLPDVIVCANDVMAMAAGMVLKEKGIAVPEDVKLTGFDHLLSARTFSSTITSVDRNWNDLGYQGMQYLLQKLEGRETSVNTTIPSKMAPGESCGCKHKEDDGTDRYEQFGNYDRYVNTSFWEGHLCDIAEHMSNVRTEEEFHKSFSEYLQRDHKYEGEELYVCLTDNFFSSLTGGMPLLERGYTETVDVICGIKGGVAQERTKIDTKQLVPGYDSDSEKSKIYIFLALYSIDGCYGYVVFGEEVPMMYNYALFSWMRNNKLVFERVRQNIVMQELNNQLSKLSVTDGLTGVYNRMGCEKVAYPYLKKCHKEGKRAVLMFADINKMKVINDKYGHLQGDTAICTVANAIREVLNEEQWIIVRYGGDEFLMVGECTDEQHPVRLLRDISDHLEKTAQQMKLPYPLKAGVGFVLVEPDEELDLSECLKKADEAMYLMKKKQHGEMEVLSVHV